MIFLLRLINQNADSSYIGSIAIGTPAVAYDVILDTGSADLWLAGSTCETGCSQIQTFDTSSSSTFNNLSTSFSITYGSGAASGALGSDVVQMAGFQVASQTFGAFSTSFIYMLRNADLCTQPSATKSPPACSPPPPPASSASPGNPSPPPAPPPSGKPSTNPPCSTPPSSPSSSRGTKTTPPRRRSSPAAPSRSARRTPRCTPATSSTRTFPATRSRIGRSR